MFQAVQALNLVEVELPEQNLSVIPGYQEFGIFEVTAENIDDLKMVTVRFYHGFAQKSAVFGIEEGGTENHYNRTQFT